MKVSFDKSLYIKYENKVPIFHSSFYLDAATNNNWKVIMVMTDNDLVASLPYFEENGKYRNIIQPPLCQFLGPWFHTKNLSVKLYYETIDLLFDNLERFDYYNQNWHYSINNWLPMYWKGYSQTTRYTYVIDTNQEIENIYKAFNKNVKRNIEKSKKSLIIEETDNFDLFFSLVEKTFQRKTKSNIYSYELFKKIDYACRKNQSRKILLGLDTMGNIHGAMYLIWDSMTVYYLAGGVDTKQGNTGVMSFLFWEAIQFAKLNRKTFDFEGSMIKSIEAFFRSFGGMPTPYYQISLISSKTLYAKHYLKKIYMKLAS